MPYQLVPLGNLSGGMNESFPPSRIRENECALLQNMEYLNGNIYPQTRRGTNYFDEFTDSANNDTIVGIHPFHALGDSSESHVLVEVSTNAPLTTFYGREPGGSFTSRGTVALGTTDWVHVVFNNLLIVACGISASVAKKWTGSGNVADLGGTPPNPMKIMAVWNNRVWAVSANTVGDLVTIEYCTLGDAEDWTDTDPVSGAGFIEMVTGADKITAIVGHRERLIIFREYSIWQIITALPNTDPDGWRLELLTDVGGCDSQFSVKPLMNDLFFHGSNGKGVQSLKVIEGLGDFDIRSYSQNMLIADGTTTDAHHAAVVENRYMLTFEGESSKTYFMEITQEGTPRWTVNLFRGSAGTYAPNRMAEGFVYGGIRRVLFRSAALELSYWPNSGTGDDAYVDALDDASEEAPVVKFRTRGYDGGSLVEAKQCMDIGLAFKRLSTTQFTATEELQVKVYFDGSATAAHTFNLTDSSAADQFKRLALWTGSKGRRFHTMEIEVAQSKAGSAILMTDLDARVTSATRVFLDTLSITS